ncbi:MAG: molecular chaperone HtpG [Anaerolineaceae bacterium 4572_78]|nr:MAG: molecular chaperone HtpG [Anaerolineaceae bacterium 4572_78]
MSTDNIKSYEFKAEVQQLLHILAHSLYTDREIFLRELISNASDALNRIQFEMLTNDNVLDSDTELGIWLEVDDEANTLTIRDTGVGMTRDELILNLGTIAKSGAADFLKRLQTEKEKGDDIIGQFGVGFYSVFMAAKEVEVITRSYQPDAESVRWVSTGTNTYTLETVDKTDRGTTIIVKFNDESKEFAADYRIENIIKKHSDFVTYPIYFKDKAINQQKAIWRKSSSEIEDEEYNNFYKQLTLDFEQPIDRLHLHADAPVQVNALLFVPNKRESNLFSLRKEPGLKIYSRNILIEEYSTNLLPNHFRFIHGVVDSEDFSLSVSREAVQNSRVNDKLKNLLTKRVTRMLDELGKEKPEDYAKFWKEFGVFIKEGVSTDVSTRDGLVKLLRFHSSTTEAEALVSLQEYVDNMSEKQEDIYYITADSIPAANNSPHMDYFKKHDMQVLYMVDAMDPFMLTSLHEFSGHALKNVDSVEIDLTEEEKAEEAEAKAKLPDDKFAEVITRFKSVLEGRVENVGEAKYLKDSPVRLVASEEAAQGKEMDRIRRILDQDYEVPKRIIEINRGHPIIQNMPELITTNLVLANTVIEQLFDNALLSEGLHPNPAEMIPRMYELIEAATKQM